MKKKPKRKVPIKVFFIRAHPDVPARKGRNHPAIEVVLRASDHQFTEVKEDEKRFVALLDTGADFNWIDRKAANEAGLKIEQGGGDAIVTGYKQDTVDRVKSCITVPKGDQFSGNFFVGEFRSTGRSYDILLGMDFLQHHVLTVDGPKNKAQLWWVERS